MVTAAGASGSLSALWDVVVQPDGKLVGFGRNFEGMVVVRVMPGGELDAGFGSGGYKFLPFGQAQSSFQYHEGSVALAGDGGVLIASYFYPIASSLPQMIVVKLKANGELDTQFADAGIYAPASQSLASKALSIVTQSDGKIIVAGHGAVSGGTTITRFSAQGDVDATFGDWQGSYFGLSGPSTPHRIDLDSQGRIFVGGLSTPSSPIGFDVTRLESDGLPSEDFGSEPFAAGLLLQADFAQTRAMLLVDDEHLYLGGFFRANEGFYMGVMRLDTAGEIDPNWGQDGLVFMPLEADMIGGADPMQLLAMPDGDLLVAGDNRLLRFDTHGVLVASFGEQGIVEGAGALAAMGADGERVVVVAVAPESDEMETGVTRLQVRRHLADGRLDASFAQAGVATFEVRTMANLPIGLALGADGAITVGSATGNRLRQQATLFRWGADGRPDAGFGDAGRMVMELSPHSSAFHALALDASGQLMAAGSSWSVEGGSDFALVRLR